MLSQKNLTINFKNNGFFSSVKKMEVNLVEAEDEYVDEDDET